MLDRRHHERRADHPVTIRWLNKRLIVVVVAIAAAVSLIVGAATALVVQAQANAALRANAVNSCDGVNLLRGHERLQAHHGRPSLPDEHHGADVLLRIRDCGLTYDTGRIVVISPAAEYRYLLELAERHRVAVRDRGRRFVPMP